VVEPKQILRSSGAHQVVVNKIGEEWRTFVGYDFVAETLKIAGEETRSGQSVEILFGGQGIIDN
jgi:hypothetical protein